MDFNELIKPDHLQSYGVALFFWCLFFLVAPACSFKAGLRLEDPPLFFKLSTFKWIRRLMLPLLLYLSYQLNLGTTETKQNLEEKILGLIVAVVLSLALLWGVPELTAHGRQQRDESAGEWRSPMLVLFRWFWLGVTLFVFLPAMDETMSGLSSSLILGIFMPLAGTLIYSAWWGAPAVITAKGAEEGDPQALDALPAIRWKGLLCWLFFRIRRGKPGARVSAANVKLCPSCMRPISNVELYESLKFDACPHCGEITPPAFTIEQYIKLFANRINDLHQAKGMVRKGAGKFETDMVQRLTRAILTMAVRERATDIHLLAEGEHFIVRGRTDGLLFTMLDLPLDLLRLVISSIKVQAKLDITEHRKPQDGSMISLVDEKNIDIRINTSPASAGETASLRLLYRREALGSLANLGMSHHDYDVVQEAITRPHGLVLVTGPTGSGKSTTLYNALGALAGHHRNIITLEDPIEYKIEGLTQMQIDTAKNFGFANGLRTIMRQDPDVIMVGEIRDAETAKMTIDAAMTGHLVFSTLHTIDTSTTIGRLMDLGVDSRHHADAITVIVAQRLIRLVCEFCKETHELTVDQLMAMGLPGAPEKMLLQRGKGCPRCHDTGYFEREGLYEILVPSEAVRELISKNAATSEIRRESRRSGMRTLLESGLVKAMLGRTTVDEVLRVTN